MIGGRDLVPLSFLPPGAKGVVVRLVGGRGLVAKLSAMGISPMTEIEVLHSYAGGPVLVMVRGARVALGRGVAMKVLVRPTRVGGW